MIWYGYGLLTAGFGWDWASFTMFHPWCDSDCIKLDLIHTQEVKLSQDGFCFILSIPFPSTISKAKDQRRKRSWVAHALRPDHEFLPYFLPLTPCQTGFLMLSDCFWVCCSMLFLEAVDLATAVDDLDVASIAARLGLHQQEEENQALLEANTQLLEEAAGWCWMVMVVTVISVDVFGLETTVLPEIYIYIYTYKIYIYIYIYLFIYLFQKTLRLWLSMFYYVYHTIIIDYNINLNICEVRSKSA